MNRIDRSLQKGSGFMVGLGGVATAFFGVYAMLRPEHRYFALFMVLLGLIATWRQYGIWRRRRQRRGLELLDTDD